MPRELMRFPITAADQARADPESVVSQHDPGDPDLLRIAFSLLDPGGTPPAVVPPFPGAVYFVPDPLGSGVGPTVDASGALTPADPADWPRTGTLLVSADRSTVSGFDDRAADIAIGPNIAWVGPVELPEAFFDALADPAVIARSTIVAAGRTVRASDADWPAFATASFLAGTLGVTFVHHPSDPGQDTIALLIAAGRAPLAVAGPDATFTIDLRMAQHAGPLDLGSTGAVPLFAADDGHAEELDDTALPIGQADPAHPSHGSIAARYLLQWLRPDVLDGGAASPVAAEVVDDMTMWLPVRITMYSTHISARIFGRLASLGYEVERPAAPGEASPVIEAAGTLPHHGTLLLHNAQLTGVSALRVLRLFGQVNDAMSVVGCTRVESAPLPTFEIEVFDQPVGTVQPRVALLPPASSIEEFAAAAAPDVDALLSSPRIKAGMAARYARVEAEIGPSSYPANWDQDPKVKPTTFHGARAPWSGITEPFLRDLLLGVGDLEISTPHPPVRPADVFVTWILEGLYLMIDQGRFGRDFFPPLTSWFWDKDVMGRWSDPEAVKTAIRVGLFYRYCGLDSFNSHSGSGSDNAPDLHGDPDTMRTTHNTDYDAYRAGIVARGISCPTWEEFHATFTVAHRFGWWRGTPGPGYTRTLTHLVAAGLYDHQVRFISNLRSYGVDIEPDDELPAAFRYMCYNSGPGDAAANGATWETVDTSSLDSSVRHYINGLRAMVDQPGVWPTMNDWLAEDPIDVSEESRTSGGARTNAIHFWLLSDEIGPAFPPTVPDL